VDSPGGEIPDDDDTIETEIGTENQDHDADAA
jgi:hypothetical protein